MTNPLVVLVCIPKAESWICESLTVRFTVVLARTVTPALLQPHMFMSRRCTVGDATTLTPFVPTTLQLIFRLRRITAPVGLLMTTPLPAPTRIPPGPESQSIVMALVMVTCPKPPGSRQSISPFTAVFEMAPAKVLHGAVRLHGLASSPTPDTQVRVA